MAKCLVGIYEITSNFSSIITPKIKTDAHFISGNRFLSSPSFCWNCGYSERELRCSKLFGAGACYDATAWAGINLRPNTASISPQVRETAMAMVDGIQKNTTACKAIQEMKLLHVWN